MRHTFHPTSTTTTQQFALLIRSATKRRREQLPPSISKVPLVLMTMKDADIISTSMLVVAFLDLVVNVHFWIVDTTEKLRRAGSRPSARSAGWRTYLPLRSRHGRRG
ncbi:hypothetical protein G6O67_008106 [Ophiocordyceps sinensis]|uniref:Transmembrane protein n=1 Tax=Ophiocordyceps sinensis TaxID=72228 RepID=A0A8H4PJR7_9HYPO|nr:hypothetical protein G6O67_008106 [Ophiocordyceps sinensis]